MLLCLGSLHGSGGTNQSNKLSSKLGPNFKFISTIGSEGECKYLLPSATAIWSLRFSFANERDVQGKEVHFYLRKSGFIKYQIENEAENFHPFTTSKLLFSIQITEFKLTNNLNTSLFVIVLKSNIRKSTPTYSKLLVQCHSNSYHSEKVNSGCLAKSFTVVAKLESIYQYSVCKRKLHSVRKYRRIYST